MAHVEKHQVRTGKETIHSGHFMVSHFEAEAQDDPDDLAVPVPDEEQSAQKVCVVATYTVPRSIEAASQCDKHENKQQLSIDISLTKLFKCMTLAYRQKLTSPKWNRFKGIKLRWKDKIRLNNVIWRCWHMQFIKKQNTLVCQFASPLDVDTHVKPEATLLEGKYWKRRAEAVTAEYKKWRMFHITKLPGKGDISVQDMISDMDTVESFSQCSDFAGNMLTDEDYLNFMSDTLFSTITNHQPFAFPDPREIARGANLADFIQPSLGPLQPNLDDFMDTLEPLQELLSIPRLPPVPEEASISSEDPLFRSGMSIDSFNTVSQEYISGSHNTTSVTMPTSQMSIHGTNNSAEMIPITDRNAKNEQIQIYDSGRLYQHTNVRNRMVNPQTMMSPYPNVDYEQQNAAQNSLQTQNNMYPGKMPRIPYVNPPKVINHHETGYKKYNAVIPPSQTAPETVSLLQQPIQNPKFTSTIVIQGRNPNYNREKTRQRVVHYPNQLQSNQYQTNYNQPMINTTQNVSPVITQSYDTRSVSSRQTPLQLQYLQPHTETYKVNSVNTRTFKMPSPPLSVTTQQISSASGVEGSGSSRTSKEQYRSHSLPVGAQLNANWSVSVPATAVSGIAPTPPAPLSASATASASTHAHEAAAPRLTSRDRESNAGPLRLRSRSSSSGMLVESSPSGSTSSSSHRPPPLNSVASEPILPKSTVMLAQLLSTQHSQSLYKMNSSEDVGLMSEPTRSPARTQHSPIGSDVMSPHQSLSPPPSPTSPRSGSPRESRRTHMHAEQKRRYNIKNGFDTLQALIPHLNTNPSAKISKAAMLQKGAEYIKQLKAERNQIKEDMESLRQQIECLNNSISNCHSMLPATGAPVSRARAGRLREMFARHVSNRTMHNWKYWLFSVVAAALVDSFSACVSCGSSADLVRTTLLWAEQHCSLVEMRPAVLNSLRVLCTTTDILTNPERLPEEARGAIASSAGVKTEPT